MKTTRTRIKLWTLTAIGLAGACALLFTGCKYLGADTAAPSAVEHMLFTTQTNYIPVPVTVTVTNQVTNSITQFATNTVGQIVTVTNEVVQPKYEIVTVTNLIPQYENVVSDRTKATVAGAGTAINTFFPGVGGMVSTGVAALLAVWAQLRSGKRQVTAAALAQEVEAMLEFIKTLPNGTQYKQAITTFLQAHQLDAGVADQVLGLLDNQVSNPDAKAAVEEIRGTLKAVGAATP